MKNVEDDKNTNLLFVTQKKLKDPMHVCGGNDVILHNNYFLS